MANEKDTERPPLATSPSSCRLPLSLKARHQPTQGPPQAPLHQTRSKISAQGVLATAKPQAHRHAAGGALTGVSIELFHRARESGTSTPHNFRAISRLVIPEVATP